MGPWAKISKLGAKTVLELSWKRFGHVLGRLGGVLGGVLGASWGVLGVSWAVLERLGASWGRLGLDFRGKRDIY